MPTLFYTGKASRSHKAMLNANFALAWVTGNARNASAMKDTWKNAYNGKYSNHIRHYDQLANSHYARIANKLLENVDCNGKNIVDVGCGTGILSLMALEKGAAKLTCVDLSKSMLARCKEKLTAQADANRLISFRDADAENLPFDPKTFDVVLSNMVLGILPNQQTAIREMTRVLRPNGWLALSAHGPAHYLETLKADMKALDSRYFLGYRTAYWPRDENQIRKYFISAGLGDIHTERLTWIEQFEDGSALFDFMASTTGLCAYHRLPPAIRDQQIEKSRAYYHNHGIDRLTTDVVIACGVKK